MKKWIMLTVCSALFFAADAQTTQPNNPSQPATQNESASKPAVQTKGNRQQNANMRQGGNIRNHPKGNKINAKHGRKTLRHHQRQKHHRRHLRRRLNRLNH